MKNLLKLPSLLFLLLAGVTQQAMPQQAHLPLLDKHQEKQEQFTEEEKLEFFKEKLLSDAAISPETWSFLIKLAIKGGQIGTHGATFVLPFAAVATGALKTFKYLRTASQFFVFFTMLPSTTHPWCYAGAIGCWAVAVSFCVILASLVPTLAYKRINKFSKKLRQYFGERPFTQYLRRYIREWGKNKTRTPEIVYERIKKVAEKYAALEQANADLAPDKFFDMVAGDTLRYIRLAIKEIDKSEEEVLEEEVLEEEELNPEGEIS